MLGKLLGGYIGHRVGERHGNGLKGSLLGLGAGHFASRGLGPLALVVGGGWAAKKFMNRLKARRTTV